MYYPALVEEEENPILSDWEAQEYGRILDDDDDLMLPASQKKSSSSWRSRHSPFLSRNLRESKNNNNKARGMDVILSPDGNQNGCSATVMRPVLQLTDSNNNNNKPKSPFSPRTFATSPKFHVMKDTLRKALQRTSSPQHCENTPFNHGTTDENSVMHENVERLLEVWRMERQQETMKAVQEIQQLKEQLARYEQQHPGAANRKHDYDCDLPSLNYSATSTKEDMHQDSRVLKEEEETTSSATNTLSLEFEQCLMETLALLEEECTEWQSLTTATTSSSPEKQSTCTETMNAMTTPQPSHQHKSKGQQQQTPHRQEQLVQSIQRLKAVQQQFLLLSTSKNFHSSIGKGAIPTANNINQAGHYHKKSLQLEFDNEVHHYRYHQESQASDNSKVENQNVHLDTNSDEEDALVGLDLLENEPDGQQDPKLVASVDIVEKEQSFLDVSRDQSATSSKGDNEEEAEDLISNISKTSVSEFELTIDDDETTPTVLMDHEMDDEALRLRQQLWDQMVCHGTHAKILKQQLCQTLGESVEMSQKLHAVVDNEMKQEFVSSQQLRLQANHVIPPHDELQPHESTSLEQTYARQVNDLLTELETVREASQKQIMQHEKEMRCCAQEKMALQAKMISKVAEILDSKNKLRQKMQVLVDQLAHQDFNATELERQRLDAQMQLGIERHAKLSLSIKLETAAQRFEQQKALIESLRQQLKDSQIMVRAYSHQVELLSDELQLVRAEARESLLEDRNQRSMELAQYRMDVALLRDDLNSSFSCMM